MNISDVMQNRVIFFCGYPGSGKGTQGKMMAEAFKIRHLSTGELFRAEVKRGSETGKQMAEYMNKGQRIPKEITYGYVRDELAKPEYRNGFILDGDPRDQETYEFYMQTFKDLHLETLAAVHFTISKEETVKRLTGRLHCEGCQHDFHVTYLPPKKENVCDHCSSALQHRADDNEEVISKRLNVFDQNTAPVMESFRKRGILVSIDAAKKPEEIFQNVIASLAAIRGSYYLRQPKGEENSSVFHNHIDAKSHPILREIVQQIDGRNLRFQNKIYPISFLHIGPQYKNEEFSSVYSSLPNFHGITNATDEAFSTGKMGNDGFDYDQVRATLQVAYRHLNQGVMTELEEDIFAQEYDAKGEGKVVLNRGNTPYKIDWDKELPGFKEKLIPNLPRFELHHGFDIKKEEESPPILPSALCALTAEAGFQNGGWFIFRKEGMWAYRSNEFSNESFEQAVEKLLGQAAKLRVLMAGILPQRQFVSSCSLEKVHAMWMV